MARVQRRALSPLEDKVMRVIWDRGPSTAEDVRAALERKAPMKDSTARTILRRLEDKGYLAHSVSGRTYVYRERVPAARAANQAVRQVIDRLCGGSVERLLLGMVDDRMISPEQLEELTRKIAQAEEDDHEREDEEPGQ
jgi:BlaI family transcriptional regulator, penicillinase repressor